MDRPKIAWYITPHGFGHAVRSLEVIRCILLQSPEAEIVLVSDIPEFLVEQNVGRKLPFRRKRIDVGMMQRDSLRIDYGASLGAVERLLEEKDRIVEEEARFLRREGIGMVVSDISFLAFDAAFACGMPSVGMSNFTWDWIYRYYAKMDARWSAAADSVVASYARCGLFLRLPMHGDCSACPVVEDVPLVARRARRSREETRRILGIPDDGKAVLIAFAALDLGEGALRHIERIEGVCFLYKKPLTFELAGGCRLDDCDLSYTDVVAGVDAVVTKPGYGILADCMSYGIPVVYSDRGEFPEYDILVETMERELATVFLPSAELYAGQWEAALARLETIPRRMPSMRVDGGEVCARIILSRVDGKVDARS